VNPRDPKRDISWDQLFRGHIPVQFTKSLQEICSNKDSVHNAINAAWDESINLFIETIEKNRKINFKNYIESRGIDTKNYKTNRSDTMETQEEKEKKKKRKEQDKKFKEWRITKTNEEVDKIIKIALEEGYFHNIKNINQIKKISNS